MSTDTDITLLGGRLKLNLHETGFKPGLDTVMLAAACPAVGTDSVLDLGCGIGSAGLCVVAREGGVQLHGIDIQADHVGLAQKNAQGNHIDAMFTCADVQSFEIENRFDHVITNPPYLQAGAHLHSPDTAKAQAMGHISAEYDIDVWVKCAHRCLKSGGSLTLIHRADHVDVIIRAMGKMFGAIEIIPLWPKAGKDAKRVIIRAIKDRKTAARMHSGLILHDDNGEYKEDVEDILRKGTAIV